MAHQFVTAYFSFRQLRSEFAFLLFFSRFIALLSVKSDVLGQVPFGESSSTYALRFCSRRFNLLSSSPGFPEHVWGVEEPVDDISLGDVALGA